MKRYRDSFNKSNFNSSGRIKMVKPSYGSDKKKVDRIEEINNEIKYSKAMTPFDIKKVKERIIKMVKASLYSGLYMELMTNEVVLIC